MTRVLHSFPRRHGSAWILSSRILATIADIFFCIYATLLTSELSLIIALVVVNFTLSPLVIFDRLNVTSLKYSEDFLCCFLNAGAKGFVPPPLVDHLLSSARNCFSWISSPLFGRNSPLNFYQSHFHTGDIQGVSCWCLSFLGAV